MPRHLKVGERCLALQSQASSAVPESRALVPICWWVLRCPLSFAWDPLTFLLSGSRLPFLLSVAHCIASSHQQVHWLMCLVPNACLQAIVVGRLQSAEEQLCTSTMPAPSCTALPAATTDQVYLALHCLQLVR